MAGQYSHKHFFRNVPNKQLSAYFKSKNVDLALDFKSLKENHVDAIFAAFNELAEDQQGAIEADFQEINAIACEGGICNQLLGGQYSEGFQRQFCFDILGGTRIRLPEWRDL